MCKTLSRSVFVSLVLSTVSLCGQTSFVDDFEDGNVNDGSPVSWIGSPLSVIDMGDGHVAEFNISEPFMEFNAYTEGQKYSDVSIEARINVVEHEGVYSFGLAARNLINPENDFLADATVYSRMDREGNLQIDAFVPREFWTSPTINSGIVPHEAELSMRFDVIGNTASLTVWPANQARPDTPQLVESLPDWILPEGEANFWAGSTYAPEGDPPVESVRVTYDDLTVTAVPEPTGFVVGLTFVLDLEEKMGFRRPIRLWLM